MRDRCRIFLFGEAEKGEMCTPLRLSCPVQLFEKFGQAPENTIGIDHAMQTLLNQHELIFYRVKEEGFSREDYFRGVRLLADHGKKMNLSAICLPGVGDKEIIESLGLICLKIGALLILSSKDLFDYLTVLK